MKRRTLLVVSGSWAALAAARAFGQAAPGAPKLIGWLSPAAPENQFHDIFVAKLKELGHVEGRGIRIERRGANGDPAQLRPLARELLALKPAVIVTYGTAAVAAVKAETATVPVVFAAHGDPVGAGLAASVARPGGNVTGVMLRAETNLKLLEQVREAVPGAKRVALLTHEGDPASTRQEAGYARSAKALRYELSVVRVAGPEDLERAIAQALKDKAQALLLPPLTMFFVHQKKIAVLSLAAQLPLFSAVARAAASGALLSYANDLTENFRGTARLVDKILRGANPGELAIEQPDRYELAINLRTAKALGLRIPQAMLLRANEVIE